MARNMNAEERVVIEIKIEQGDITQCRVDAIVNAANNELILGGGVAGAISRAGGPTIQQECDRHGPVAVGEAAITTAGDLLAEYVIHQASMCLGGEATAEALKSSTEAVLRLAEENSVTSLAFPAVGTGVAGFDTRECACIMLRAIRRHARKASTVKEVHFVLFSEDTYEVFREEAEVMNDV